MSTKNEPVKRISRRESIEGLYRLSGLQQGILFHGLYDPESGAYMNQFGCDLIGADLNIFKKSWVNVLKSHTALRTVFYHDKLSVPVQCVFRDVELPVTVLDYRSMSKQEQAAAIKDYEEADLVKGFDFTKAPLMRIALMRLDETRYRMLWTYHHIIFDGWSIPILMVEFLNTYESLLSGKEVKVSEVDRFEDFIRYVERSDKEQQQVYWRSYLKNMESATLLPFISNTTERNKGVGTYKSAFLRIDPVTTEEIQNYAKRNRITINTVMQGVWSYCLHRYTGARDVVFGVIVSGRPDDLPGVEQRVGLFINPLPLHSEMVEEQRIVEWLQYLQHDQVSSRQYQHTPLHEIQALTGIQGDILDCLLTFENYPVSKMLTSGHWSLQVENVQTNDKNNYPLTIIINISEQVNIRFSYNTFLLKEEFVKAIINHFQHVLLQMVRNEDRKLKDINMLTQAERHQLLVTFNDSKVDYPKNKTVVDLFEEQATKTPGAIAVEFEEVQLNYQRLNERANQLAHLLRSKGVKEETMVPICLERSPEMIVGILAILKAGGAYVPIEPDFPDERKRFVLEDTAARTVISSRQSSTTLPVSSDVDVIEIDGDWSTFNDQLPFTNCQRVSQPHHLAYVIYTSGSTGTPKGVMIEHRHLVDYIFGLNQKIEIDRCKSYALVSSIATDLGNTVIYPSLVFGGCLHVFSKESVSNIEYLHKYFEEHTIECLKIVPSHWKALSAGENLLLPYRLLIFGGEALQSELIENIRVSRPTCSIVNHYGPTETTIGKLLHLIEPGRIYGNTIPIGKPFSNTRVYVLDNKMELTPFGVPGQLFIAGDGTARGYLNKAHITKEKFVPDTFNAGAGSLMYATGDMVKYLPDGNIEFIGRIDDQVKIRGYRIELGEIETAINQSEMVKQAVVLAREDNNSNKRLVAYVVSDDWFDRESIVLYLKEKLPDYMVPAIWVELESFPMLPNGKVDRKALPDADIGEGLLDKYEEPRNETERKLVKLWQDVLEVQRLGINDDFFELGGHSLLAVRLISLVRKEFEVEIPISDLFDYPTIKSLTARILEQSDSVVLPSIKRLEPRPERIPLSFSQERLWFIDTLEGSIQYHVPTVLRLRGKLNIKALEYALQQIVNRHEVLRTVIQEQDGRAYQVVKDRDTWKLNIIDGFEYSQHPERLQNYVSQLIHDPFDLRRDQMIRGSLITLNSTEHVLVITIHHIASDGWSKSALVKEVVELYSSFIENRSAALPLLAVQYADYAIWQRNYLEGVVLQKKLDYWKNKLEDVSPLQLPTDFPRPAVQSTRGTEMSFVIEPSVWKDLQHLGQKQGTTLFMTLLAAFKVLMHRYSGQEDICIGTPIAGRQQQDLENLIGFFVNTLALRTEVKSSISFTELLQKIKATTLEAFANQEVPFEKVVDTVVQKRDLAKNPLFQVMFVLRNTPEIPELKLGDVHLERERHAQTTTLFDITFFITETSDGLSVSVQYCTDLYQQSTIGRMIAHFQELLHSILKSPDEKIGSLSMLTTTEKQQLLVDFNNTTVPYPADKTIIDLFEEQVRRIPDAVAIVFEEQVITYKQLNERSNQLARYLVNKGVGAETLVAVCIERSHEMIIGILAVLKAGGAYVPIDPDYPEERIRYMLQDTATTLIIGSNKSKFSIPSLELLEQVLIDEDWPIISQQNGDNLNTAIRGEQLSYVIYTSGSTGKAKGVMIEHRNVYEFICWCREEFSKSRFQTVYAGTSICFDLSVFEIFYPITVGKRVRVIENGLEMDKYLSDDREVMTNSVPTIIQTLLNEGIEMTNITVLNMAGEPIPIQVQQSLDSNRIEIRNLYGPTEDTTYSTVFRLQKNKPVLIGKPISNTKVYIVSRDMQLVPVGIAGEICISGAGVARGYLNRADLTNEKFIANPFSNPLGEILYKTGDLGRWLSDGNLEYLGRLDHQVKIRGYRIELGEIETVLSQSAEVDEAVVVTKQAQNSIKKLVGYIVPNRASVKAREKELYSQQVSNWKELYETEYEKTEAQEGIDPEFNIIGWNDSFAGVPIPAVQMKEWLNDIVSIILAQDAGTVLEIGCGTGLIFYQLAGRVEKYIGTDFSRSSINQVRARISQQAREYGPTELQVCAAHEISLSDTQRVDTVILNSVVQYFPGEDYLSDVIAKSISILKGQGRIIIGDVRDNRLLRLFKSRLMLQKFQDTVRVKEFDWAVNQEMLKEEELCFSPVYFYNLKSRFPEISHVDIQQKKGTYVNELTLYRYNVIVYVGTGGTWHTPDWQNWADLNGGDSVVSQLQAGVTTIALRDVPNFRLWKERLLTEALDQRNASNVGELKQVTLEMDAATKQVMQILTTAEENHLNYQLLPHEDPLKLNILIEKNPSTRFVNTPYSEKRERNAASWTNVPLFSEISLILQKDIRTLLQQRLPDYMIPQELVSLAKMPLTSNGKVDRAFLTQREDRAGATQLSYEPPATEVEQKLAVIWQDLLGIERVGIHDDFFELGGHSLLAMRVISAIRKQMGVELAIKELFHLTTIGALAKYIEIQANSFSDEETSSEFELINI